MKKYIKYLLSIFIVINAITYAYDYISIGKTFPYTTSCDQGKNFGYVIGKGWGCTKTYPEMIKCFEDWKVETNQPNCKLLRKFEMNPLHIHRWLSYAFDPTWHHRYIDLSNNNTK